MIKSALRAVLKRQGYELCSLYPGEAAELNGHDWMSFREAQAYRALSSNGQISLDEAKLLGSLVRESDPNRPIIEIGTLFGHSTLVMTMFKRPEQRLITVDSYCWNPLGLRPDAHYAVTQKRLAEAVRNHNVEQVRMDKGKFYAGYSGPPPALFFCDADHSYEGTLADLKWARSVGASIICGDDYDLPHEPGTARAVNEMGGPKRMAGGLFVL